MENIFELYILRSDCLGFLLMVVFSMYTERSRVGPSALIPYLYCPQVDDRAHEIVPTGVLPIL